MISNLTPVKSSFRDPSGSLFFCDKKIYRQVNRSYHDDYQMLMSSGLYDRLVKDELLVKHQEVNQSFKGLTGDIDRILAPELIGFISHPYEWSFSQYQAAALTTLTIQKIAIEYNMVLKDASAYNVQFEGGKALFIDTLSFTKYNEGQPWVAYKQFCQHFLAPLALMSKVDIRFGLALKNFIDGIPLDLASKVLPFSTKFSFGLLTHLHIHAKSQAKYSSAETDFSKTAKVSKLGLIGIIDNLHSTIKKMTWKPEGTEWADYYENTNYSDQAFEKKKTLVKNFIKKIDSPIHMAWDVGANDGEFSRTISPLVDRVVSFDIDPAAVELNYRKLKSNKTKNILPLLLDVTNPSSAIGWNHEERASLLERGPADVTLALALIHHLAISNNVPFSMIAEFFSSNSKWLIIEFVPKEDSQVKRLLKTRIDIFPTYDKTHFEKEFKNYFDIVWSEPIEQSERTLYLLMAKKE